MLAKIRFGVVGEAVKDFLSTLFAVTAISGGFLIWGGLSRWADKVSFANWFPLVFIGGILLAVGIWYHRDSWFFKPPMKSEDMELMVGNRERKGEDYGK